MNVIKMLLILWLPLLLAVPGLSQEDEILSESYEYEEEEIDTEPVPEESSEPVPEEPAVDDLILKDIEAASEPQPEPEPTPKKPERKSREKKKKSATGNGSNAHDINICGEIVGGERMAGAGGLNEWQGGVEVNYTGTIQLSDNVSILMSEDIDGMTAATDYSPVRELNCPANSLTYLGLGYFGNGSSVQVRGFTHAFLNNEYIDFPVDDGSGSYLLDASMIHRNRSGVDLYFDIPIKKKVFISGDVLYTNLFYDFNHLGHKLSMQSDGDLWARGSVGIDIAKKKKFSLLFGGLIKHDLNTSSDYNMGQGYAGIESVQRLFKKKLNIRMSLLGRYYMSPVIGESYKDYADGLGLLPHLRFYWRLKPRFYLKGNLDWEIAPTTKAAGLYFKQKYMLAIRKAGKNLSAMEFGGWLSAGSLVPRICVYGNGFININQKFQILPGVRAYLYGQYREDWVQTVFNDSIPSFDESDYIKTVENGIMVRTDRYGNRLEFQYIYDGYKYTRTDFELIFRHKFPDAEKTFFNQLSLYYGAKYQLYTNVSDFADSFESPYISTFRLILGVSSFL